MKSAPASMASHDARATLSSVASSPVSRITFRCAGPQASRTARISSYTWPYRPARNAPRSMTMSTSSAPGADRVRDVGELHRERRPARRERGRHRGDRDAAAGHGFAGDRDEVRVDADGGDGRDRRVGRVGLAGLGAHGRATLPGVSAPSSVVRSTIRMAMSSAHSLASFLIDRVASAAARSAAPTWSTPGRPCSTWRSAASERGHLNRLEGPALPAPTAGRLSIRSPRAHATCAHSGTTAQDGHAALAALAGPEFGEARLDHGVDDPQPLVEVRERALHRVDREPLDVRPAVAERLAQGVELRGQRDRRSSAGCRC